MSDGEAVAGVMGSEAVEGAYQVMTLSAMGEADTPAGGSVCIRCERKNSQC